MNKTKLGINEYLFVALIFVGAIWGVTPMLGLMLFAAVVEKSEIINAGSRMALIIKVGFLLVQSCLNFIEEIVRTFADDASGFYRVMNKIDYFLDAALLCTLIVFIIINGVKGLGANKPAATYVQPQAPVQPVQAAAPQAQAPAAAPQAGATVCPKCGNNIAPGTTFCAACGTRIQ
ncbi:MAG: zinc ribbon domain-containing protein [Lachnospiraceae bacterium]|nr:zinc ribbon domain-containing protein [Lachnospiraceae bacterium]